MALLLRISPPVSGADAADKPPGGGEKHGRLDQQHGGVQSVGIGDAKDRRLVVADGTGQGESTIYWGILRAISHL